MINRDNEFSYTHQLIRPNTNDCLIDINCIRANWPSAEEKENKNTLTDVIITVGPGQLLAVVGHVGAGKVRVEITLAWMIAFD